MVMVYDMSVQHLVYMGDNHGVDDGATVVSNLREEPELQEESYRGAERDIKLSSFFGTGFDTAGFSLIDAVVTKLCEVIISCECLCIGFLLLAVETNYSCGKLRKLLAMTR